MSDSNYMARPTEVLEEFLSSPSSSSRPEGLEWQNGWAHGRMATALELVGVTRLMEARDALSELVTPVGRTECVSLVTTMLTDLGLWEQANELYDTLCEWRRLRFVADRSDRAEAANPGWLADAHEREQPRSGASDAPPARDSISSASSQPEGPDCGQAPQQLCDAQQQGHQSPDADAIA